LIGKYFPTERNHLSEVHYQKLGFTQVSREPNGTTVWELDVESAEVENAPMEIHRVGFDVAESAPA